MQYSAQTLTNRYTLVMFLIVTYSNSNIHCKIVWHSFPPSLFYDLLSWQKKPENLVKHNKKEGADDDC